MIANGRFKESGLGETAVISNDPDADVEFDHVILALSGTELSLNILGSTGEGKRELRAFVHRAFLPNAEYELPVVDGFTSKDAVKAADALLSWARDRRRALRRDLVDR